MQYHTMSTMLRWWQNSPRTQNGGKHTFSIEKLKIRRNFARLRRALWDTFENGSVHMNNSRFKLSLRRALRTQKFPLLHVSFPWRIMIFASPSSRINLPAKNRSKWIIFLTWISERCNFGSQNTSGKKWILGGIFLILKDFIGFPGSHLAGARDCLRFVFQILVFVLAHH